MFLQVPLSCRLGILLRSISCCGGHSWNFQNQRMPCWRYSSQLSNHASTDQPPSTNNNLASTSSLINTLKPVAPSSHESPSFLYDPLAQKFVNMMMWDGKKSLSQSILKEALQIIKTTQLSRIKSKGGSSSEKAEVVVVDPMAIFHKALENCMPVLGTSGVRRGGKLYHVPYPLPPKRRQFLASKWIIHAARGRSGHDMAKKLAAELLEAYNNQGTVIKKKQDLHRLAEANRAFAHFRW